MKINGNAVRPGHVLLYQNKLCLVVKTQHTQPGKGGAYLQVELKNIRDGTKFNERLRSSESVERVRLEENNYQLLFKEGGAYTLMDVKTFAQVDVDQEIIGEHAPFLQEGTTVTALLYEGDIISLKPPDKVVLKVVEADAVIKGQTATASYKPAVLSNGLTIKVPHHVGVGMRIVVETQTRTYVERA